MKVHVIVWDTDEGITIDVFLTEQEVEKYLSGAMRSYDEFVESDFHNETLTDEEVISAWKEWQEVYGNSDDYVHEVKDLPISAGLGSHINP